MDDFSLIILGAAVVLGLPIMAISAFIMVLGLKGRVKLLEAKVEQLSLASGIAPLRQAVPPVDLVPPVVAEPEAVAPSPPVEAPVEADEERGDATPPPEPAVPLATPPAEVEEPIVAAPSPPSRPRSLEETLGARWAVWVGGLALALGGIFLVRFTIEAGLVGPGARIVLGLAFSLGLIGAGEYLRRRDRPTEASLRGVYIPGVVTAAGTAALFATVYAAHALYGFIGPGTAFVGLGLVGVAALLAAALHGPWLAALGLLGAYVTPFLVSSDAPNAWALTIYLVAITATSFALARLRLWRWLALATSLAAFAWGFLLLVVPAGDAGAIAFYILALAALVIGVLVVEPHRHDDNPAFDGFALGLLAILTVLAVGFAVFQDFSTIGLGVAMIVAAALLAVALAFDAIAPAATLAALALVALLVLWPIDRQVASEPFLVVPGGLAFAAITPEAVKTYLTLAAIAAILLFASTTARLLRREAVALPPAVALSLAGAFGPMAALAVTYLRATGFTNSLPFGVVAVLSAAALSTSADRLFKTEAAGNSPPHGAAGSIHVAGATAALALALTMLLEGSSLTLAFALSALGCAFVTTIRPLAALRWSAAAFAVLVMLRSGGAWTVLGEVLTSFPGWGDIALRYALPSLALFYGGVLLRRRQADTPAAMLDGASIVLGALAAALAIRLYVRGPEGAMSEDIGLGEAGLYVALAFAMALGFGRGALSTTSAIHRLAAPIAAIGASLLALLGPIIALNPLVTSEDVVGGAVVNNLLLGYAFPALLAGLVGMLWERMALSTEGRMPWTAAAAQNIARIAYVASLLLALVYVTLETRVLVSGPDMSFSEIPAAESYAYSAVWLLFGIVLLAIGILSASRGARLGSALVILLAVAKVFLIDMSALEGLWRALSFIGLGAVLIGVGLVYQRLLFASRRSEDPPQTV